jgi:hypothetical protein
MVKISSRTITNTLLAVSATIALAAAVTPAVQNYQYVKGQRDLAEKNMRDTMRTASPLSIRYGLEFGTNPENDPHRLALETLTRRELKSYERSLQTTSIYHAEAARDPNLTRVLLDRIRSANKVRDPNYLLGETANTIVFDLDGDGTFGGFPGKTYSQLVQSYKNDDMHPKRRQSLREQVRAMRIAYEHRVNERAK